MKKYSVIIISTILLFLQCFSFAQKGTIDSLLNVLKTIKHEDTSYVYILNKLSWEYRNFGDYKNAHSFAEKAESLAKTLGFKKGLAKALNIRGGIYLDQGDYPKSLEFYLSSIKISEEIGDKPSIAKSFNNIGIIYEYQNDNPKALDYHLRSLKIKEEIGDEKGIAASLNNIGLIYEKQGDNSKALDYHLRSLKIKEEIGDENGIAASLHNIGIIYKNQGNYPKALEYYLRSLKIDEEIGDKKGISLSFINLGSIYYVLGNTSLAIEYGKKGLALAQEIKALGLIKNSNKNLSDVYLKINQHQKAFEHFKSYIAARDSLFNEENTKKLMQSEMNFEFEKREQSAKLEQEKKDAIALEEQAKQKVIRNSFMSGFALLLLLSVVIFKSYRNKKKANELISLQKQEVEQQKHTIEEKQKDILDSIHYAKRIQDALLKEEQHISDQLPEHFVLFKPKDIISGDFYWAHEKQDHLYLAAADCTGHGVPGAMMSMLGIAFLNEIIGSDLLLSPAEVLNQLRDKVIKELGSSGNTKDGMDISLCRINLKTKELQWAGANNPLWFISSFEGNGDTLQDVVLTEIKADKQPIGFSDVYKPFTNHIFNEKDCMYYLFTDGYADQFGGPKGKKFKYKPFQEKLLNIVGTKLDAQKNALNETFDAWKGELEQVDDVCLIGIRI